LVQGVQLIRVQSASLVATWRWRSISDPTNNELVQGDYNADRREVDHQDEADSAVSPYLDASLTDNPHGDPRSAG
jgi:hypothetical protein